MKHAARIGLRVFGCIVAAIALLAGSTMLVLRTSWGSEKLRHLVVARVNDQIQGHFDIAALTFGGDHLALRGVELRDPGGRLVADIASIDVAYSIVRLLHKEMRVKSLRIDTPQVGLLSGADGTNLTQAIAPRNQRPKRETPARPKTTREGWVVNIERLELSGGDVAIAVSRARGASAEPRLHLAALQLLGNARYALGNGSLELAAQLDGESRVGPVGPLHLTAAARARGDELRSRIEGVLLGGTIRAHTTVLGQHIETAEGAVAIDIPAFSLAGHTWGPLHVDGATQSGVPILDFALALPGIALDGKGGGSDGFSFDGKLMLDDLALAARAAGDLTGRALPPVAGHGRIDVWCGGKMNSAPVTWSGRAKGALDRLRVGDSAIEGLTLEARTAHLAKSPDLADLEIHVASIHAGTTKLGGLALSAAVRGQALSAKVTVASPEAVELTLSGTRDPDPRRLALQVFTLRFPDALWALDGEAQIGFGGEQPSLSGFRLRSQGQTIAADASKAGDALDAHLVVKGLRLALLPHLLVDPALHLGGLVEADVHAYGASESPHVVAHLTVDGGRARGWSRIDAKLDATLDGGRITGSAGVDAPFAAVEAAFSLPGEAPVPGAPIEVRVDVARLDLGEVMRGVTAAAAPIRGRMALHLRLTGAVDQPTLDLTAQGSGLQLPAAAGTGAASTDLGQGSLHLTYADGAAHANLTFAAARGGSLRVDASATADLGYPRVLHLPPPSKLPVHGKVVARDLDVGWVAQFNPRVESLGGRVTADARLTGTLADPQFVGDVRWKDGGGTLSRVSAVNGPQGR
jgi:hypothetical protein